MGSKTNDDLMQQLRLGLRDLAVENERIHRYALRLVDCADRALQDAQARIRELRKRLKHSTPADSEHLEAQYLQALDDRHRAVVVARAARRRADLTARG